VNIHHSEYNLQPVNRNVLAALFGSLILTDNCASGSEAQWVVVRYAGELYPLCLPVEHGCTADPPARLPMVSVQSSIIGVSVIIPRPLRP